MNPSAQFPFPYKWKQPAFQIEDLGLWAFPFEGMLARAMEFKRGTNRLYYLKPGIAEVILPLKK